MPSMYVLLLIINEKKKKSVPLLVLGTNYINYYIRRDKLLVLSVYYFLVFIIS